MRWRSSRRSSPVCGFCLGHQNEAEAKGVLEAGDEADVPAAAAKSLGAEREAPQRPDAAGGESEGMMLKEIESAAMIPVLGMLFLAAVVLVGMLWCASKIGGMVIRKKERVSL